MSIHLLENQLSNEVFSQNKPSLASSSFFFLLSLSSSYPIKRLAELLRGTLYRGFIRLLDTDEVIWLVMSLRCLKASADSCRSNLLISQSISSPVIREVY